LAASILLAVARRYHSKAIQRQQRVVLTQFESMEKAQAWRNAPAYQELRPEGRKSSKLRQFVVEGIAN